MYWGVHAVYYEYTGEDKATYKAPALTYLAVAAGQPLSTAAGLKLRLAVVVSVVTGIVK